MGKLYLYRAKRDKKGMQLLATFPYDQPYPPTKVEDVRELALPEYLESSIKQKNQEDRLRYEMYIEYAESYQNLCDSLKSRGYSNLPLAASPAITTTGPAVVKKKTDPIRPHLAKKKARNTMLKRKFL